MAEIRSAEFKVRAPGRFERLAALAVWVTFGKGDAKADGGAELSVSEVLVRAHRTALPDAIGAGARVVLSSGETLEVVARYPQGRWTVCKCKAVA